MQCLFFSIATIDCMLSRVCNTLLYMNVHPTSIWCVKTMLYSLNHARFHLLEILSRLGTTKIITTGGPGRDYLGYDRSAMYHTQRCRGREGKRDQRVPCLSPASTPSVSVFHGSHNIRCMWFACSQGVTSDGTVGVHRCFLRLEVLGALDVMLNTTCEDM